MELTPVFHITANGSDVTDLLQKNMIRIGVIDEDGTRSDEITLEVAGAYTRPKYGDELKLWLGYKETGLEFLGLYKVQSTTREGKNLITIKATATDFGGSLKVKKSRGFKNMSYKDLCTKIASEHNLKAKCDFDVNFKYIAQHDESDLAFLSRLAKEANQIFSIKNNTLFFGAKKREELTYKIDYDECISCSITHTNKTKYGSVKASWRDTKQNKDREVTYNKDKPTLTIQGSYKDENEAMMKAIARLEQANKGTITGSITTLGRICFAGGRLELAGSLDDGIYGITKVSHEFSSSGFTTTIEFEN